MNEIYAGLVDDIVSTYRRKASSRILVGIAGPPGCGKSTIAANLVGILNTASLGITAQAVPLDGFHYTRKHLDALPNREEAYIRRGAPWTFDVEAILQLTKTLRQSADTSAVHRQVILAPSFDHALKDPVDGDVAISPETSIILLDGNYLLLDEDKWRDVGQDLDFKIFVDVDPAVARNRVAKRHVSAGIEPTLLRGQERFDTNDGINGELIRSRRVPSDVVVLSVDEP